MIYKNLILAIIFSCFMVKNHAKGGTMLASSVASGVKDLLSDRKKDIQSAISKKAQDHHIYKWLKSRPFYLWHLGYSQASYLRNKYRVNTRDKTIAALEGKLKGAQSADDQGRINAKLDLVKAKREKLYNIMKSREDDINIAKSRLQSGLQEEKTRQLGMKFDDIKMKLDMNKGPGDAFGPSNRFYNSYDRLLSDARYQYIKTIQMLTEDLRKTFNTADKIMITKRLSAYKAKQKAIEDEWQKRQSSKNDISKNDGNKSDINSLPQAQ